MMQPHDPIEGEYTDSELPLDAEVPKEAVAGTDTVDDDGDWGDDDVVVEEVEVIEFTDDRGDRPLR
ncbi:hypothetical protein ACFQ58_07210 [Agromyces sp. NPDC056523]|uniref:hypothetical protein n=1 Tax=Agromyces sp. NPDC056523 TaxID=3345850 RepID=UPI00366E8149